MKNALFFLSTLFLIVIANIAHADPGMGGSGGGPRAGQWVTVQVCNGGDSGTTCQMVTYRVLPPSGHTPETKCMISVGDAGEYPCPAEYGALRWLRSLNKTADAQAADDFIDDLYLM